MNSLWGNIFKGRSKVGEVAEAMAKVPVFKDLGIAEIALIERIMHVREFKAGEPIFHQGAAAFGMYIILSGSVAIQHEPSGKLIAELSDGEFFGELALFTSLPRSAAAIAQTPCRAAGFFQSDLFDLLDRNPRLGVKVVTNIARIIGERLIKSNEQVQALTSELERLKAV